MVAAKFMTSIIQVPKDPEKYIFQGVGIIKYPTPTQDKVTNGVNRTKHLGNSVCFITTMTAIQADAIITARGPGVYPKT